MKHPKKTAKPSKKPEELEADEAEEEEDEEWAPEKLPPLPKAFAGGLSWDEFEASLKPASNKKAAAVTSEQSAAAARAMGLSELPPSYIEYVQRFGQRGEWQLTYRRERFPRFLNIRQPKSLKQLKATFAMGIDARVEADVAEPVVIQALVKLLPFGTDASSTDICWDPALKAGGGELGICFVDGGTIWRKLSEVRTDAGAELLDVLKYFKPRY